MIWWARLRRLWQVLDVVPWACESCRHKNETPTLLWESLRTHLLCARCSYQQNYPDYIGPVFDPRPFGGALDRPPAERVG